MFCTSSGSAIASFGQPKTAQLTFGLQCVGTQEELLLIAIGWVVWASARARRADSLPPATWP